MTLTTRATTASGVTNKGAPLSNAEIDDNTVEVALRAKLADKDATGGYAGLTLFKLNLRNAANTVTSWFTTDATAARTWTMPDKSGTVAMTSDITGTNTFTGAQTAPSFIPNSSTVPTNGMYTAGTNTLNWSTNSVLRLTLSSTGDLTATGNVTAYSDERLKTNWRDLPDSFIERLALVKSGIYDRTDQAGTQIGVSAQSLAAIMPHAVLEDADGMLSVAYGNAALTACVMLAREVQNMKATLAAMKAAP